LKALWELGLWDVREWIFRELNWGRVV